MFRLIATFSVEVDRERATALEKRIHANFPKFRYRNAQVLNRDANTDIDEILKWVPKFNRTCKGLTFCFVDPFNTQNLRFATMKKIADALYVDFVVLIPSFMDIKRNEHNYTRSDCPIVDDFLGTTSWRKTWSTGGTRFKDFGVFVADQFGRQNGNLELLFTTVPTISRLFRKGQDRSLYLYHLGFFSRSKLGVKFWRETRQRTQVQTTMNLV